MKLHYPAETDSLHAEPRDGVGVEARETAERLSGDLDPEGRVDIDRTSHKLDLITLETFALSLTTMKAA